MKLVDAEKLKEKYPGRKSLNMVLDSAEEVNLQKCLETMCKDYCKIPYKFSIGEWESICGTDNCPCNSCPLNELGGNKGWRNQDNV